MNYGPLLFLAAFFALASSWFAFVLTPVAQLGRLQPANTIGTATTYPLGRPGLARQGLEVYRANGCAQCHSQQVGQYATVCDVMLTDAGTNQANLLAALRKARPDLSPAGATHFLTALPKAVLQAVKRMEADAAVKNLTAAGAKATVGIVPVGPDLARGWGQRRTVAEDFIFDSPVLLGGQRIGPDLANVGLRLPDAAWHLRHLYAPRRGVPGSTMPPYRFLFTMRKLQGGRSTDALVWPAGQDPAPGFEVLPEPEARALAAYLLSLRADAPLFEAPLTVATLGPATATTNAPAATDNAATNAPPTTSPGPGIGSPAAAPTNAPAP